MFYGVAPILLSSMCAMMNIFKAKLLFGLGSLWVYTSLLLLV